MNRDILAVTDDLINVIAKHHKDTPEITQIFKNFKISFRYMAPELLDTSLPWERLLSILRIQFPVTEDNMNDPFIMEMMEVVNPSHN